MGMGKRKDPFCVFSKITEEENYPIYQHRADILDLRDDIVHRTDNAYVEIKKDKNIDYITLLTTLQDLYSSLGDVKHHNEIKEEYDKMRLRVSSHLLFREAHILKWNRIEEWF